ncbi:hypothetical protein [Lampropedia aestuarii]|uniref:hypothetical protein n=1 Tax=Lampropedia aestuarii TaxID=2562762 RepID=UPI002468DDE5|nr:hypothetical protein [Lampropedia aestuarii]MDH5857235.1 hypothetical protein [Lampropedia aestuarii]
MRIGDIRSGKKGFPIAPNLVKAGFDVCSFGLAEPALAAFANNEPPCVADPSDTAQNSSFVLTNALLPALSSPRSLSMAPRLRSTRPGPSRRSCKPVAIGCIDAPIADRTHAAASTGLTCMACGRGVELARARPMPTAQPTTSQSLLSSHAAKGHQHKGFNSIFCHTRAA